MTTTPKRVPIPKNGVDYRGKIVLAPMVRSGELPTRLLALKYGADLVWGPETIDKAIIGSTIRRDPHSGTIDYCRIPSNGLKAPEENPDAKESRIYRLHPELEGRKLIFQMGTSNPATAVQAARLVAGEVAGIDVNAGCPKPFSVKGGMGAALLRTPDTLVAILEALVKEIGGEFEIGISVKIRLLETPEETEALVRRLVGTGITGLTLHCRTTPMRPRERAIRDQLRMVAGVCREAGVACLMNGDVTTRDEALKLVREYGVDGAMIATAAEKNPSCFRPTELGGLAPWREVVEEYLKFAIQMDNRWGNTKFMLAQLVNGKELGKIPFGQAKGYTETVTMLKYESLIPQARELDKRLELGEFKVQQQKQGKKNKQPQTQALNGQTNKKRKAEGELEPRKAPQRLEVEPAVVLPEPPVQGAQPTLLALEASENPAQHAISI